jgi:two-component system, NarL family, sensor histidine kinase DesK
MERVIKTNGFNWTRLFNLVWLGFLLFPVQSLFERPRSTLEYLYVGLVLLGFVATFVWAFFWSRWIVKLDPQPLYRFSSLVGMAVCYATMLLLLPVISWNGIGMLIYAGSFAGTQRSFRPGAVAIAVAAITVLLLLLFEGLQPWVGGMMFFFTVAAAVGNHLSYREAITNLRLRRSQEEVARIAKIAERERIARDLHDLLGHTLSVIVLKSELASRLAEHHPTRAAAEIRDVERIARESLQEVRSAVRGYRSAGLEAEFASVRLACEAAGLKLELYLEGLELEWATEQTLSFVLREAVTNAIRHAKAKTLWVSLERAPAGVRLTIWDDGSGLIAEGNGIQGIRERVTNVQGKFEFSAEHKGITVTLPLEEQSEVGTVDLEGRARV